MKRSIKNLGPLASGAIIVIALLGIWSVLGARLTQHSEPKISAYRFLEITKDGEVVTKLIEAGENPRIRYLDLSGKEIPQPAECKPLEQRVYLNRKPQDVVADALGLRMYSDESEPLGYWYLIDAGGGQAFFVGYDTRTYRVIGYLTKNGFQTSAPPEDDFFPLLGGSINSRSVGYSGKSEPRPFEYPYVPDRSAPRRDAVISIHTGSASYRVGLKSRTVTHVDAKFSPRTDRKAKPKSKHYEMTTDNRVQVIDPQTKLSMTILLPPEFQDRLLSWYELPGGGYFAATSDWDTHLYAYFDASGRLLRTFSHELTEPYPMERTPLVEAIVTPSPGIVTWKMLSDLPQWFRWYRRFDDATARSASIRAYAWPLSLCLLLSLGLGIVCFRTERRLGVSILRATSWVLLVLLAGPLGYVAYLLHSVRPRPVADNITAPVTLCGTEVFQ